MNVHTTRYLFSCFTLWDKDMNASLLHIEVRYGIDMQDFLIKAPI